MTIHWITQKDEIRLEDDELTPNHTVLLMMLRPSVAPNKGTS